MGKIEVILLAIFAVIVIFAIVKGASISMRVKNWFSIDSKKPSTVDVGKNIDVSGGEIQEAVGIKGGSAGREVSSVKILENANARGAKIGRLVGIEDDRGVPANTEEP